LIDTALELVRAATEACAADQMGDVFRSGRRNQRGTPDGKEDCVFIFGPIKEAGCLPADKAALKREFA
jgi:hypothetical protein